ncbi:tetratricopeptide repeat protein [Stygiolobus caldivivus]|uniref:Tetratricopeptide repeat protein n=1 Tax=Stygiolobus caldivivus TaxID=2824673 RepID=A0A8D5U6I0_9CREN|nr:tetratricopeptide repeat protein [Stygiolobus caldivivus]BCU70218.1 hypothetical protein KN1_15150 [Stygiolobus caldivivus]
MSEIQDALNAYKQGNLNYALRKIQEVVEKNPSQEAYNLLGKILKEMGKDNEALDAFLKAGNKIEVAKIYLQHGLYRDAIQQLTDLNEKEARLIRALAYIKLEEYEKAKEELTNLDDNSPIFLKAKGIVDYHTGDYYEALRELSLAIEYYPYDAELFYYRALTKQELNMDPEDDVNIAISLNPYYAELYYSKGVILESKGKIEEAIKFYSRALEVKPQLVKAYYRRAKAYMKMGKEDEAMKDIESVNQMKNSGSS